MNRSNLFAAACLLAINSLVFIEAWRVEKSIETQVLGPGLYVAIIGCVFLIFNIIFLFSEVFRKRHDNESQKIFGRRVLRTVVAVIIMAVNAGLIPVIGFSLSTTLFFIMFFWFLSGYGPKKSLILGLVVGILLHLIFVKALEMPLPSGYLGI